MRDIDWDKPLSQEDVAWVNQYGTGAMRRQIDKNQDRFESVAGAVSEGGQSADDYDSMTLEQLKEEAKNRKQEDPDFDVSGVRNKTQLIERLREWDTAQEQ